MTRPIVVIAPHFAEYSLNFCEALAKHRRVVLLVDKSIYEGEIESSLLPNFLSIGSKLIVFSGAIRLAFLILEIWRLHPSYIHLQEASGRQKAIFNLLVTLAFKPFVPVLLTVHDPIAHSGKDALIQRRVIWLQQWTRRLASACVVHGKYCAMKLREASNIPEERIIVTRHGVIIAPPPGSYKEPSQGSFLIFGRMEHYKGLEVACNALEILTSAGKTPKVVIAGRGPELDGLQSRLEAMPGVSIENRYVSRAETLVLMQQTSAVLLPYLDASQSGVVPAAFANGRAVVVTSVGGLAESVQDHVSGMVIKAGDSVALAEAIQKLMDNKELVSKLTAGAAHAATTLLDWDLIVEVFLDQIYAHVPATKT